MKSFSAEIFKIGINPFVFLPGAVLGKIFLESGKNNGPVPVKGKINGHDFKQTLVKYSGEWRLYLNTPMRTAAGIDVGDIAKVKIEFDPEPPMVPMPPALQEAFGKNKRSKAVFERLIPSRQKEIMRYIGALKTEESRSTNIKKVIQYLAGKGNFIGRSLH